MTFWAAMRLQKSNAPVKSIGCMYVLVEWSESRVHRGHGGAYGVWIQAVVLLSRMNRCY